MFLFVINFNNYYKINPIERRTKERNLMEYKKGAPNPGFEPGLPDLVILLPGIEPGSPVCSTGELTATQ